MKNIILLVLVLLSIKINAYEYLFYYNNNSTYDNQVKNAFFVDSNGKIVMRLYHNNKVDYTDYINYSWLSCIKFNYSDAAGKYIKNNEFKNYYKNDLLFLNSLFTSNNKNTIGFLNYLYNSSRFDNITYIYYENYELLYNSDGLIVASVVNGDWAGLYDNVTRSESGYLYSSDGALLYVDGVTPSFFQKIGSKLISPLLNNFMDANALIPLYLLMSFLIIFMLLYFSIRLFKVVFRGEKWTI